MLPLKLEVESQAQLPASSESAAPPSTSPPTGLIDITKFITILPAFCESEVDSYFALFESIAGTFVTPTINKVYTV